MTNPNACLSFTTDRWETLFVKDGAPVVATTRTTAACIPLLVGVPSALMVATTPTPTRLAKRDANIEHFGVVVTVACGSIVLSATVPAADKQLPMLARDDTGSQNDICKEYLGSGGDPTPAAPAAPTKHNDVGGQGGEGVVAPKPNSPSKVPPNADVTPASSASTTATRHTGNVETDDPAPLPAPPAPSNKSGGNNPAVPVVSTPNPPLSQDGGNTGGNILAPAASTPLVQASKGGGNTGGNNPAPSVASISTTQSTKAVGNTAGNNPAAAVATSTAVFRTTDSAGSTLAVLATPLVGVAVSRSTDSAGRITDVTVVDGQKVRVTILSSTDSQGKVVSYTAAIIDAAAGNNGLVMTPASTLRTVDAAGHTVAVLATPLVGASVSRSTDSAGRVSDVTMVNGQKVRATILSSTDSQGRVVSYTAAIVDAADATVQGALVPYTTVVTTTDKDGRIRSFTTVATAPYTTVITTTDKDGRLRSFITVVAPPAKAPDDADATLQAAVLAPYTTVITRTDKDGNLRPFTAVVAAPTAAPVDNSVAGVSNARAALSSVHERIVNVKYTNLCYFGAIFAAPIMAIIVKSLFDVIVSDVKMMEPFHRLHRLQGASAGDALFAQYLASTLSVDVLDSILDHARFLPLWTLLLSVLMSAVTTMSSFTMLVRATNICFEDGIARPCAPVWIINVQFTRIVQGLLISCMAVIALLLWSLRSFKTSATSNPGSIMSIAMMMNHGPLVKELQAAALLSEDSAKARLEHNHFWFGFYRDDEGVNRHGIMNLGPQEHAVKDSSSGFLASILSSRNSTRIQTFIKTFNALITDLVHLSITLILLILLLIYRTYYNSSTNAFVKFFSDDEFLPKAIIMVLVVLVDASWKSLEREVRIREPYRRLWHGNARPEHTILQSSSGTCWSSLPMLCRDCTRYPHMWFQLFVALTSCLSDINILVCTNVLFTSSQLHEAYEACAIAAITITSAMIPVLLLVMVWWRRSIVVRDMPWHPDYVAGVMLYLCGGQLLKDIARSNMGSLSTKQRDEMVIETGRRYRFGKMMCEDLKERWCIDYDDEWEVAAGLRRKEMEVEGEDENENENEK